MQTLTRPTSREAFHHLVETGKLGAKQQQVYHALEATGPATANEVFEHIRCTSAKDFRYDSNTRARFTELRNKGLIIEQGLKRCTITGRRVICWAIPNQLVEPEVRGVKRVADRDVQTFNAGVDLCVASVMNTNKLFFSSKEVIELLRDQKLPVGNS
jgi:hypothetical protein